MRALVLLLLAASASAQGWAVTPEVRRAAGEAPVVVRHYATEYAVAGPGRATTRVRLVATALDPAGRETVAELGVVHGGFRQLRRFEGTLYDADGREVRTLGRRDAEDRALGSIYEDLKVRRATLYGARLPFTVEWTYEIEHDGVLDWPTWRPQQAGWPVQEATFELSVPTGTPVRTRARDIVAPADRADRADRGRDVRTWRVANLSRATVEEWGPPGWEQLPELRLGTDRFEIGGAPGRLDSWGAFGAWYDGLGTGRQTLPPGALAEVRGVVEGATTDAERARRLYRHLQTTTRYVSIQLGLGGWQPFDAAYVFERRYGDCKALTNYMLAMLEAVGIAADPVLIEAGNQGSDLAEDFPQNAFNHVVLRVPLPEYRVPAIAPDGAVWLECTSPYAAFGHLGSFTEGRPGLLVDGAQSRIVRTPTSTPAVNWTRLDAALALDDRGGAVADVRWTLHGEPRTDAVAGLAEASALDRATTLRALAGLASADLDAVDVSAVAARPDTLVLSARLVVPGVARRAGTRLLVGLTPFAGPVEVPPAMDVRRHPVRLGPAYARRDSVRIALPPGYAVEGALPPVEVVGVVGRYALRAVAEGGVLVVVRELIVDAPDQPAAAYDEVRAFFRAVAEADGARAIARRE